MNTKEIAVTAEELKILETKLKSLQTLVKFCSKVTFPLVVIGVILFMIYRMESYVFLSLVLAGMFEAIAMMDVSEQFKKAFKVIDEESRDDKSTQDISIEKIDEKGESNV